MHKYPGDYLNRMNSNEDFSRSEVKDIIVYKYNFTRATVKEAQEFRSLLLKELDQNNLKIIVDLSECDYIDSTFLGALVFVFRRFSERSGKIQFIKPYPTAFALMKITGIANLISLSDTFEEALQALN